MKAQQLFVLRFMRQATQFIIPIYQRHYAWTKEHCGELWDDIMRTGESRSAAPHFIGSIVYTDAELELVAHEDPMLIIDGQQRLTTLSLLIVALAEALEDLDETKLPTGLTATKLRNRYLVNADESGERRYKLILSDNDRDTLKAIVEGDPVPSPMSKPIHDAYEFFQRKIHDHKAELERMWQGLSRLMIVEISLNHTQNNPQLIFESLNSKGVRLSQADLIRNYVLMGLSFGQQERLYRKYWLRMEQDFGALAYRKYFDSFMRQYLALQRFKLPTRNKVYKTFKQYVPPSEQYAERTEALLQDIRVKADYYQRIRLGEERDADLRDAFDDIKELRVDPAVTLLMELYDFYARAKLPKHEFLQCIRMIESYVFRRHVCGLSGRSYKDWFVELMKDLDSAQPLNSLRAAFLRMSIPRRFPKNGEFHEQLKRQHLFGTRITMYLLRRLAGHGQQQPVDVKRLRAERIMPGNSEMSDDWMRMVGTGWRHTQDEFGGTIGNLTLVRYGAKYSKEPFQSKKKLIGGFGNGPVVLNGDLRNLKKWDQEAIRRRADRLAALALEVWAWPGA